MSTLSKLEEDYYNAANALTDYRNEFGFVPGVKVKTKPRYGGEPMLGVIEPYGERWASAGRHTVPVLFDNGRHQPWAMSQLEITPP